MVPERAKQLRQAAVMLGNLKRAIPVRVSNAAAERDVAATSTAALLLVLLLLHKLLNCCEANRQMTIYPQCMVAWY